MTENPKPHVIASRVATIIAVLLLLFLFIFPRHQIKTLCELLLPYAQSATTAVTESNWEAARIETEAMYQAYKPYDNILRLYLDHQDVDALHTRLLSCLNLAKVEDDQIIVDLEDTKSRLKYLESVETFSIWNLF